MPILAAAAITLPIIFGQPLGAPIAVKECPFHLSEFLPGEHLYEPEITEPCFQNLIGHYSIEFPNSAIPEIMSIHETFVTLSDGKVSKILTAVIGHNFRERVISKLTAKFGTPTSIKDEKVVLNGIPLIQTVAFWSRPGFVVQYESISDDLETGSLTVWTSEQFQRDADEDRRASEGRVKL